MAFYAKYTVPGTEKAIVENLKKFKLRRSLAYDKDCVIQWAPFSKLKWKACFEHKTINSSFFVHSGFGRKVDLFETLKEYMIRTKSEVLIRGILPFRVIRCVDVKDAKEKIERIMKKERDAVWVLKQDQANNALGVHFIDMKSNIYDLAEKKMSGYPIRCVLQRHVDCPLLLKEHKFHLRANVLAFGNLDVYFHRDVVAHISTKKYDPSDWNDTQKHVTNHCVQSQFETFDRSRNTTLLQDGVRVALTQVHGEDETSRMICEIYAQMKQITKEMFRAFETRRKLFLPMPNCFEIFGLDFIVDVKCNVYLLEVNTGPGLEGHCMYDLSSKIVSETLNIVLCSSGSSSSSYEKILGSSDSKLLSSEMKERLKRYI